MRVQDGHASNLALSTALSGLYAVNVITPLEVIFVLNEARVNFVLIGAHGLSGWMKEPRATQDVDVVVAARHSKKATRSLLAAFPGLEAGDEEVVTRLRDRETGNVAIDVLKPNQALYRAAFKHTQTVRAGGQSYKIPSLEMAVAMKFGPMVSPSREDAKKYMDAHDFILIVRANPEVDLEKLAELGELVDPGGGKDLLEMVRQVQAGEKLNL